VERAVLLRQRLQVFSTIRAGARVRHTFQEHGDRDARNEVLGGLCGAGSYCIVEPARWGMFLRGKPHMRGTLALVLEGVALEVDGRVPDQ
jgi:hypothetical protein